jgi:8-oxo-(d)GTP phosphatase
MSEAAEAAPIRAAGAVLWRPGPEILLVHRPKYDDWSLPKGKQEPGEHILRTAVREVEEETSVRPVLGPWLRSVAYFSQGRPKTVDYWVAPAEHGAAAHEIDAVAWLPVEAALDRLSYPHDKDVVRALVPRRTVPLILLRHASAGRKGAGEDDLRRPLDAAGTADAATLADLLTCFAPRARVLSSPALRCTETVRPYAEVAGVPIETDRSFYDHLGRTDSGSSSTGSSSTGSSSTALIRSLVAAAQPAIVCLHRENLPVVLGEACAVLGAAPPPDPDVPKGAFWVVHTAAGRLAAADRYEL